MKQVEFIYEDEETTIKSSFDGNKPLKKYFNQYIQWLISIGFTKKEITEQMNRFCNYTDEISTKV